MNILQTDTYDHARLLDMTESVLVRHALWVGHLSMWVNGPIACGRGLYLPLHRRPLCLGSQLQNVAMAFSANLTPQANGTIK